MRPIICLVFLVLFGCATAPATQQERDAAACLRDALAQSPWIVSANVAETAHHVMLVRYEIRFADGRKKASALIVGSDEPYAPPGIYFFNDLGDFPTASEIDELLGARCPTVKRWQVEI